MSTVRYVMQYILLQAMAERADFCWKSSGTQIKLFGTSESICGNKVLLLTHDSLFRILGPRIVYVLTNHYSDILFADEFNNEILGF